MLKVICSVINVFRLPSDVLYFGLLLGHFIGGMNPYYLLVLLVIPVLSWLTGKLVLDYKVIGFKVDDSKIYLIWNMEEDELERVVEDYWLFSVGDSILENLIFKKTKFDFWNEDDYEISFLFDSRYKGKARLLKASVRVVPDKEDFYSEEILETAPTKACHLNPALLGTKIAQKMENLFPEMPDDLDPDLEKLEENLKIEGTPFSIKKSSLEISEPERVHGG